MKSQMEYLVDLLDRAGVPGCTLAGPARRRHQLVADTEGELARVQWGVRCPPGTQFASRVGFRYCAQKALRLSAANAYWRFQENVKRQHAAAISATFERFGNGGTTLEEARNASVEKLRNAEPLVNEYYANPPMTLVNNRRRKSRANALSRLDFRHVRRPAEFFRDAGCLGWFLAEGATGRRRTYVAPRDDSALPTFTLAFAGKRARGAERVYDLTVPGPVSFTAAGIVVHNSIPTRMTIGQVIEAPTSLLCQHRGEIVDGTSFRTVRLDQVFEGLEAEGARYCGMSRMYNGRTGEYFDAAIVIAPTASQRLLKFVADDKYAAPGRGPTDTTTHQPLDGKNARGGLRVGEMEAWVLETHGAMAVLTEKMFCHSDGQDRAVCRRCGQGAIYNPRRGLAKCNRCRDSASVAVVDSCHASIVALAEIRTAGIDISLVLQPLEFPC